MSLSSSEGRSYKNPVSDNNITHVEISTYRMSPWMFLRSRPPTGGAVVEGPTSGVAVSGFCAMALSTFSSALRVRSLPRVRSAAVAWCFPAFK